MLGELDRRHWPLVVEQRRIIDDDVAAPAIDHGVDVRQAAADEVGVPAAGAEAHDGDLAVGVGCPRRKAIAPLTSPMTCSSATPPARARARRRHRDRRGRRGSRGAARRRGTPWWASFAGLLDPLVPAGHVMDDDDAWERAWT